MKDKNFREKESENSDPSKNSSTQKLLAKKYWTVISVAGVVCFTLIMNAPALITNLENLPGDVSRVKINFMGGITTMNIGTDSGANFQKGMSTSKTWIFLTLS